MNSNQKVTANMTNAVSTTLNRFPNSSGTTKAERAADMKTRTFANTTPTNDFDAQGNNIRIALDNGDGHTQQTNNTYAFDNAGSCYPGQLSYGSVRLAASDNKRAQDETTVRKSEFTYDSDGLSLLQTVQPDNALAVVTTCVEAASCRSTHQKTSGKIPLLHFCKHLNSYYSIREARPADNQVVTEHVYDDSQSVTNPRSELSATSKYRVTITGSVAPPSTTWYDRTGRAIRAYTLRPDGPTFYRDNGCNEFDVAAQKLKRVYTAASAGGVNLFGHRYEFDSIVNITQRTDEVQNFTKNMACNRLTDATMVGASTVVSRYDDLGTITNRTTHIPISAIWARMAM